MISREEILSAVERLPTLPVSLAKISALASCERSTMLDIERALRPDPALTANILRLANSAYFGLSGQVTSVSQAVKLLGTRKVLEAAMGGAFSRLIPSVLPGYGITAEAFWRHSIAVAVLSERMNTELGLSVSQDPFTCGLLHDIGKLVTSAYLAQESTAVVERLKLERCSFVEAERDLLGVDHAEVGSAMAEQWRLPEAFGAVARLHHSPEPGGHLVIDLVHVADCLAHAMGYGADLGELSREIDGGALARIKAPVRVLERIVSETASHIEGLTAVYNDRQGSQ